MSYAISFPDMFSKSTTNLKSDFDAVKQDLVLLLAANKGGLYGDPWYGTDIKSVLWEPNHRDILVNVVQDQIYESVLSYMPNNIALKKDNIRITILDTYAHVEIDMSAYSNKENDMLSIDLLNENNIG